MPHFVYLIHPSRNIRAASTSWLLLSSDEMNVGVQIPLQDPTFDSLGYIPKSEITRSPGNSIYKFLTNLYTVSLIAEPYYFSITSVQVF